MSKQPAALLPVHERSHIACISSNVLIAVAAHKTPQEASSIFKRELSDKNQQLELLRQEIR